MCHIKKSFKHAIYIYDIPYFYREQPRKHWYKYIHGKEKIYDDSNKLNFAFSDIMNKKKWLIFYSYAFIRNYIKWKI